MYNFKLNIEQIRIELVNWIRDWFSANGKGCNAVIGISGGKDSSVVAALCVEALGKDRVIGIMMPNGSQDDINYSYELIKLLGIKSYEYNIGSIHYHALGEMKSLGLDISEQTEINLPARLRMTALYALSQSSHGRVSNNCNLSENWVGYSTRFGDDAGDFSPLGYLTVQEVIALGRELGLPEKFIIKTPSDGLCGVTDEDRLGFTYVMLDNYIRTGEISDTDMEQKIVRKHKENKFKLETLSLDTYDPELPMYNY